MVLLGFLLFLSFSLPCEKLNVLEHTTTGIVCARERERLHTVGRERKKKLTEKNTLLKPGVKHIDSVSKAKCSCHLTTAPCSNYFVVN